MDLFRLSIVGSPPILGRGDFINNLTSKLWVERYSDLGEFSIEAPLATGLKTFLPLGTLISQVDSKELMIVENHNINDQKEENPIITVSGRSFPGYLDNRIIGSDMARASSTLAPYILSSALSWNQIKTLIDDHIHFTGADDKVEWIQADESVSAIGGEETIDRTIKPGGLWQEVKKLLAVDDLGIKTVRNSEAVSTIEIYRGVDRSNSVMFSWNNGDLESAEYLFSQQTEKNAALVVGTYIWLVVDDVEEGYERRFMLVDAADADSFIGEVPTGAGLIYTLAVLAQRGREALRNQSQTSITQADISPTTRYQYRRDFNVGDLVTIDGNFNELAVMRITEYAEVEDENGYVGHPTLEFPLP